jgi:hypothetical protein
MRRILEAIVLSFCLSCILVTPLHGKTINVPAQQPTIQGGINAASTGDTVLVAPGTYYENINFSGKAITVTSSGGPSVTIIDGSKTYAATVTFATSEKSTSILSGFTLQNGASEIEVTSASPTIKGNIVTGSTIAGLSGIYNNFGAPLIEGNLITAAGNGGIWSTSDTGIQIIGNVIAGNGGAGINSQYAGATNVIEQNSIIGNSSYGVLYFPSSIGGNALFVQNLVYGNGSEGLNLDAPFTMISNTVTNNSSGQCCGASEVSSFSLPNNVTMQNNLLVATGELSAISCVEAQSGPVFTNNDVFAAYAPAYGGACTDQTGISGNVSVDPLFVDILSDNFHIQSSSPAIGAGTVSAPHEPTTDMDGDSRTTNGAIDIGADEYSAITLQTVSTASLHFNSQDVGTTSAPQTVTFANNSKSPLTINMIAVGQNFSQTNNCPATLAANATCQISVNFSPMTGTTINSALGIFTSATQNPEAVSLVGTGVVGEIEVCCGFYFGNVVIGTTSTQSGTITNDGLIPVTISGVTLTGSTDYSQTNNCPIAPNTLAIGASCTLNVTLTPTFVGQDNATVTIAGNLSQPYVVNIYTSVLSAGNAVLNPTSLTFPTTLIGQVSAPQTMTLSNNGTGALGITSISTYSDFQQTNNCPTSLAVNASCILTITYAPSVQGAETGSVQIYTDSEQFNIQGNFTGTGSAPVPTITSLSLTSVPAGSADTPITVTGTGFVSYSSELLWNGSVINGYTNGTTQFQGTIPAAYLAMAGTYQISVFTPTPGGGTSNSLPFVVYTPVNYAEKSVTYSYQQISGTNLNMYYGAADQITSPFPIQFGGGSFTTLTVGAGGTISFNGFASENNDVIPTTQTPMLIAPFWASLYPFGSGTNNNVFWEVSGTAPNRHLVVEWRNVGICCETTNTIRFEVIFSEGTSDILFNYADTIFGGSYGTNDNGATATSGVQVAPNLGTQFSYDQPRILSKTTLQWLPGSPTVTLSTSALGFGYHQIGIPSVPQMLTLTNGGQVPLNIASIATDNADYTTTNTCGSSVAPGKSCTITATFDPSLPEAESATLTVIDNAINSPQTVALSGIGSIEPMVIYPILVNFGSIAVGKTGSASVTLANASNKTMTIQQIATSPSVFSETNNCGSSLAAGLSCTVTVTFKPTQKGSVQGKLSMGLNGKPTKAVSTLTGSGS